MRLLVFRIRKFNGKIGLLFVVFALFVFFLSRGLYTVSKQILSAELISSTFPGRVSLSDADELAKIGAVIEDAAEPGEQVEVKGRYRLLIKRRAGIETYVCDNPGVLCRPSTGRIFVLTDGGQCLRQLVQELEKKNPYGEFMSWDAVDEVFRLYDKARVIDFETGLGFTAQRRAGKMHADVQPLTAEDSAVMKKIYDGRWSWKRRAIILEVRGRRIAASMNGMPHGAGAISGNAFDGHFCIHFRDSRLHTNRVDPAHQLMVWKAAGKVGDMLVGAAPEQILRVMMTAVEQDDKVLAASFISPCLSGRNRPDTGKTREQAEALLGQIRWLVVGEIIETESQLGAVEFQVKLSYGLQNGTDVKNRTATFLVLRSQGKIPWQISFQSIEEFFQEPPEEEKQEGNNSGGNGSVYRDWKVDLEI